MEVDGSAEAVPILITARGLLEPLDHRVDAFEASVRDASLDGVQHAVEMGFDPSSHTLHRLQPATDRPDWFRLS